MEPLNLTLSLTAPVPYPDPHQSKYLVGWTLTDSTGILIAAEQSVSVRDEDPAAEHWLALLIAVRWLRSFKAPIAKLTVRHYDADVQTALALGALPTAGLGSIAARELVGAGLAWEVAV